MSIYLPEPVSPFSTDPVRPPIRLDGFRKLDVPKVPPGKPLFAVVLGGSGTGRSAAARDILDRYRDARKIDAAKFIVPDKVTPTNSAMWTMTAWLQRLRRLVRKKGLVPPELEKKVKDATDAPLAHAYIDAYAECIEDYATELEKQGDGYSFGFCLENVGTWDIIDAAVKIFESVDAPCVFTVQDNGTMRSDIFDPFVALTEAARLAVELSFVTGDDVACFAETHWDLYGQGPQPFETKGVKAVFDEMRDLPIGRARTLLGSLHGLKDDFDTNGPAWNAKKISDTLKKMITNMVIAWK